MSSQTSMGPPSSPSAAEQLARIRAQEEQRDRTLELERAAAFLIQEGGFLRIVVVQLMKDPDMLIAQFKALKKAIKLRERVDERMGRTEEEEREAAEGALAQRHGPLQVRLMGEAAREARSKLIEGMPFNSLLEAYPFFKAVGKGTVHDAGASAEALRKNLHVMYDSVTQLGWPSYATTPPSRICVDGETYAAAAGIVNSEDWYNDLLTVWYSLSRVEQSLTATINEFYIPAFGPETRSALTRVIPRSTLPTLRPQAGRPSVGKRSPSNIRIEEARRLAISYIYGRELPVECLTAILSPDDPELLALVLAYAHVVKIVNFAADRADMLKHSNARVVATHVRTVTQERAKLEIHKIAAFEWFSGNAAAGRNPWVGPPLLPETPGVPYTGPRGRPPSFNQQALTNSLQALASYAMKVGFSPARALNRPDELARHIHQNPDSLLLESYVKDRAQFDKAMGAFGISQEVESPQGAQMKKTRREYFEVEEVGGAEVFGGAPVRARKRGRYAGAPPAGPPAPEPYPPAGEEEEAGEAAGDVPTRAELLEMDEVAMTSLFRHGRHQRRSEAGHKGRAPS